MTGFQNHIFSILGRAIASPSHTRGGSRMRESRPYGSVRGARGETRVPTATRGLLRLLTSAHGSTERTYRSGRDSLSLDPFRTFAGWIQMFSAISVAGSSRTRHGGLHDIFRNVFTHLKPH